MKKLLQFVLLFALTAQAQQGQVIDRILAVVNSTPVFQSEWEAAVKWEALMDGRSPESLSASEVHGVFDRLVDQELIEQQMKGFALKPVTDEEVKERLAEIRAEVKADTEQGWAKLLASYGLTQSEVDSRVRTQIEVLRFLDVRFRATSRVDYRTVQNYYRNEFIPALQKKGVKDVPPLSEVTDKIREVLTQQRMTEQTNAWLDTLRQTADIRYPKELATAK